MHRRHGHLPSATGIDYELRPTRVLPEYQSCLDRWYVLEAKGALPLRADYGPALLAPVSRFMLIWETFRDAAGALSDSTLRFIGPGSEILFGNITGVSISTAPPSQVRDDTLEFQRHLVAARQPIVADYDMISHNGLEYLGNRRLGLPLSRDGRDVDFILVLHRVTPGGGR